MAINSDLNKALIEQVSAVYQDAELKMLEKLAKRAKKGITDTGWNEDKAEDIRSFRKQINAIAESPSKLYKTKISESLIEVYYKGVNSANKDLGLPNTVIPDIIPYSLQRLILETNQLISGTSVQVLRNVDDAYRSIVAEVSTGVLVGVDSKQQAAQDALNRLANKGITGFVDKAGRNWQLSSYVNMAIRTSTSNAALQGHIDRQTEIGSDLIKIPGFGNTCPLCAPWENKILSISGKDPNYPSLQSAKEAGLFHPNCKHTIIAYQPELFEGEDAVEPLVVKQKEYDPALYNAQQTQRFNERQIRHWKKRKAVAITKIDEFKANAKINYWQQVQREHVKQWNLKRKYANEMPMSGKVGPTSDTKLKRIEKDLKPNKKYNTKTKSEPDVKLDIPKVEPEQIIVKEKKQALEDFVHFKQPYPDLQLANQLVDKGEYSKAKELMANIMHTGLGSEIDLSLKANIKALNKVLKGPDVKLEVKKVEPKRIVSKDDKMLAEVEGLLNKQYDAFLAKNPNGYIIKNFTKEEYVANSKKIFIQGSKEDKDNTLEELRIKYAGYKKNKSVNAESNADKIKKSIADSKLEVKNKVDSIIAKNIEIKDSTIRAKLAGFARKGDNSQSNLGSKTMPNDIDVKEARKLFKNKSIPEEVVTSIETYTGSSYRSINAYFRDHKDKSYLQSRQRTAVEVFESGKFRDSIPELKEDKVFYRHSYSDALSSLYEGKSPLDEELLKKYSSIKYSSKEEKAEIANEMKEKLLYSKIKDKAPVSTSFANNVFQQGNGQLEIQYYLPKGSKHGIPIEGISTYFEEREFLLDIDQEFVIFDVEYGKVEGSYEENLIIHVMPEYLFKELNK